MSNIKENIDLSTVNGENYPRKVSKLSSKPDLTKLSTLVEHDLLIKVIRRLVIALMHSGGLLMT